MLGNQRAVRLVIYSLLIGSVLPVFSTGVQLLLSYQRQKTEAVQVVDQVDKALAQSLEIALRRSDFRQVDIILDGLATNDIVSHIDLSSETGRKWERGAFTGSDVVDVYELVHRSPNQPDQPLGTLVVDVSLDSVEARVWDQFWVTFQTNLAKAYVAAIALLFVAHELITRHLHAIAAHVAGKASRELHNQLTNILEMSRLDSNAVKIVTCPTDVRELAKRWRDSTKASVHFHGKSIRVTLDADPALDECQNLDGARPTQIVTNLTDNAAKFTASGEIRISVRSAPEIQNGHDTHGIEICVSDTGEGIGVDQRHLVFERFTQSDAGLTRAHGGSGLGLTISREICELMGAQLSLDSTERDGFSTRFLITLGCTNRLDAHECPTQKSASC